MVRDALRVVIVGAGVTGLLTAIRCAQARHHVTLLDRGAIPNPASTSFDQHRAIRALDPEDAHNTAQGAIAQRRWRALETTLGTRFYRRVGVVTTWPAGEVAAIAAVGAGAGLPIEVVSPERYPHITFPAGSAGVLEREAGVLLADRVLQAAARWLGACQNVVLRPWQRVSDVNGESGRVTLAGGGGTIDADLTLIAAGPWSRELVDLPVVLQRQTMVYLRPPDDLAAWWDQAPSAGRIGADGLAWLLPSGDGTQLKISTSAVCREVDEVADGDEVANRDEDQWAARVMAAPILPGLDRYAVIGVKRCHYAVDAATGGGLLTRLSPAVWARAASGGDGFRTAPLVADRIAEAMTGVPV